MNSIPASTNTHLILACGGTLIASPEGFFVKGKEGPLKEGELKRAASWAKVIVKSKKYFNNETSVAEK